MPTIGRLGLGWQVLRGHLLARRHEHILPGEKRLFAPGLLRPSDLVTCDIRGHHLEAGVPIRAGQPASTGYGGANIRSVFMRVTRDHDGDVTAECGDGNAGP
jgi:hypothetical protein